MALEFDTLQAPTGGINQADDPEHIADDEALWIQDGILDTIGRVRRRGPLLEESGWTITTDQILDAIVSTSGDESEYVALLTFEPQSSGVFVQIRTNKPGFGSDGTLSLMGHNSGTFNAVYGWASVSKNGLVLVSFTPNVDVHAGTPEAFHTQVYWYGGANLAADVPGSPVTTKGSTAVTGTGSSFTSLEPGAFLVQKASVNAEEPLLGKIKSIESATAMTLERGALASYSSSAATARSIRPFIPHHGKGKLTVASSGTAVTGVNTKFKTTLGSGMLAVTDWELYRRADGEFIGAVSSIADETTLTLSAGAGIAMTNESFVAIPSLNLDAIGYEEDYDNHMTPGVVTAHWSGRQWYLNSPNTVRLRMNGDHDQSARAMFSALDDPEDIDWSPDGDWFDLGSNIGGNDAVLAAQATERALLIFKRSETVAITGRTPSEFVPDVILNDGILHPKALAPYKEGAVWAGAEAIYWFDGTTINDLTTDKLGDFYPQLVENIAAGSAHTHKDKSVVVTVERNHAFIYIDNANPNRNIIKTNVAESPDQVTLVVNLKTGAISTWKNAGFRASFTFRNESGGKGTYVVGETEAHGGTGANAAHVFNLDNVFSTSGGADDVQMEGMSLGPDFYVEQKRWSSNSEFIRKKLKRIRSQYLSVNGPMSVDLIVGKDRGDVAGVFLGSLTASGTFNTADILLTTTVDEIMGLRFYEGSDVTDCSLGEHFLFYKTQRTTRAP